MSEHALTELFAHPGPWTEEDYRALPEGDGRIELLDGGLLVSPNPASPHQRLLTRLWRALDDAAPPELEVLHTVNVRVGPGKILIPDLVVVDSPGADFVVADAAHVLLALEVTSPGTVAIDRAVPGLYAAAGIPTYVRVEIGTTTPSARVFTRRDSDYVEDGLADDHLRLREPFVADVDLPATARIRSPR